MKGKLDESVFVFIIAIALLIVLLVISNVFFPGVPTGEANVISSFQVGLIGSISDEAAITKNLGSFTVGETQTLKLKSLPRVVIQKGYFGEKKETIDAAAQTEFLSNIRGAKLIFTVSDTNKYGNLTIKWNGREVFKGILSVGSRQVLIPADAVKNENNIEIYADPPGLFFWASTAYLINNFDVNLEYGPDRIVPFELTPSELQAFSSGAIKFSAVGGSTDRLIILVNGAPIYQAIPTTINAVEFSLLTSTITPGVNVITFSAPDNAIALTGVNLDLFLNTNQVTRTRTFNISQEIANVLAQGFTKPRLVYTVSEVRRPGALQIKINNQGLAGVLTQQGQNSIDIPAGLIRVGENVIEFSATGTFVIPDASIVLVK